MTSNKHQIPAEDLDPGGIIGGIDTHGETIHVAVIDAHARELGDREFPTTPAGYRRAISFLESFGEIAVIGVEGTSSYGAGFTQAALRAGIDLLEVVRPDRSERRRLGKSDPIDAYQAARAALAQHRTAPAKNPDLEGIRALHHARRSAMKARHAAIRQIKSQLVTAPVVIREKYRTLSGEDLILALARARTWVERPPVERAVLIALQALARRCLDLQAQHAALGEEIDQLVTATNPGLRAALGVGPDTAAQLLLTAGGNPDRLRNQAAFAALCGAAPVQASSGKTNRHRLSRGGDRAANNALYRIALVRMSCDPRTKTYVAAQRARGRSTREIIRQLKRAIAREIFTLLTTPATVPDISDLRTTRQAKNITITAAANHFGIWPAAISGIERGTRRNDDLAHAYREWLRAA
jgi:transposase